MAKQPPKTTPKEKPKAKQRSVLTEPSFWSFMLDRSQWLDWAIIGGLSIVILIFLKIYYPYPQTETDSGNYILSAANGKINGYRPFGYSAFMSFFHGLSSDVRFVVTWQWLLTFISATFFLFSIKYMYKAMPQALFYVLALCCLLNPSIIYMDAYMMSDSLFLSLTILFLTTCMWVIYNGSWVALVANLILLWWSMDTRYIGLFYPIFSAAAIGYALFQRWRWVGVVGAIVPLLMLYMYRASAIDKMKEEFGVETFSAFGGWQKANNGVAVLPYVKVDANEITDPQVKAIHQIVRAFPDSFFNIDKIMATDFMWTRAFPGKQCLFQYIQQTNTPYAKAWAYMSTQMDLYGDFLQSRYRSEFISHFVLPNFQNIFKVYEITDYKEFKTDDNMKSFFSTNTDNYHYRAEVFKPMTTLRSIGDKLVWILLILTTIAGLVMLRKIDWTLPQKLNLAMLIVFIGAFCGASAIAAPINNFRYMMPIIYCQLAIPVLIVGGIVGKKKIV